MENVSGSRRVDIILGRALKPVEKAEHDGGAEDAGFSADPSVKSMALAALLISVGVVLFGAGKRFSVAEFLRRRLLSPRIRPEKATPVKEGEKGGV